LTSERIRPYHELLREPLLEFVTTLKGKVSWEEFESEPEVYRVGDQVHYLVSLTIDRRKDTYCFTLLIEEGKWSFQHVESIVIRLDNVSSLPTSTFPDIPEEQKAWILEEYRVSEQVRLFNFLSQDRGRDFAFNWFRDGAGYFLAARAWVPFVPASRAFILFLCWEQANLRGNSVTLEKLDDEEAILRMESNYFKLYAQAMHLKQQISSEDYRQIFETVWHDRASNAGWDLGITFELQECLFHFKKQE